MTKNYAQLTKTNLINGIVSKTDFTCKTLFVFLFIFFGMQINFAQSPSVFTTSGTWVCPQGVTTIQVEAWGGGAGGGASVGGNNSNAGGGGGGAYARRNSVTVVPGTTYTIAVGNGGASATNGNNSTAVFGAVSITAAGGSTGSSSTTADGAGGLGGTAAASVGDVVFRGGNGANGTFKPSGNNSGTGGGGGSGAGSLGNGNDGAGATAGGVSLNSGGAGGNGGVNAKGTDASNVAGNYGGGGGGGGHKNKSGGDGRPGAIVITFICPVNTVNAGLDQTLTACATTATLAGSAVTAGTGTWTLQSGTATITSPNSPTSGVTGLVPGTTATLRWTVDNGRCGSSFDDVIITSPAGAGCLSYCASSGGTYPNGITGVNFNTINNLGTTVNTGYQDFTSLSTNAIKGSSYNLSVYVNTGGNFTDYQTVYFDWNGDGDFADAGELISLGSATNVTNGLTSLSPLSVAVPIGAVSGAVRMRIKSNFNIANPDPCQTGFDGEVEDYTINIVDPAPCVAPTAQPTALVLTPASGAINGSFTAAAPVADGYLVVISTSATPPSAPVNGTIYTIGSSLGAGYTIVDTDGNTTFTASGLSGGTTYYFYIYSFNGLCSGGPLYLGTSPLTGNATSLAPVYCVPTIAAAFSANVNHHINKVAFIGTLQDIVNTSTYTATAPLGYEDYTGLATKAKQAKGEGVNIYIESPFSGYIKAWVDWNADGDFLDAGETVYNAGGVSQASTTLGFIVPTTILAGNYRVRIRVSGYNGAGTDAGFSWNACSTNLAYYGETEDYLLEVIDNCANKIVTVTDGSVCGSGVVSLQATSSGSPSGFRWYSAETGGALLDDTASGSWVTPSISTTTDYWVTSYNGTCETLVRTKITAFVKPVPTISFATSNTEVCGEDSVVALTATGGDEVVYLLDEDFEGGMGTFTNVHYVSNPAVNATTAWQIETGPFVPTGTTWFPAISSNFGANNFAFVNSDVGTYTGPPGSTTYYYIVDNGLVSNTVDSSDFLSLTLKFRLYFDRYYQSGSFLPDELMTVDVSTDAGANWIPISGNLVDDIGYGTRFMDYNYNLDAYINETNLKVRFRYYTSTWANGAAVDDIELFGTKPLSTALEWSGTPLPDVFTDAGTTIPYSTGSPATTVYVKPQLSQLETGSYTFTATATLTNGCNVSQDIIINNKSTIWKGTVDDDWNNPNNWSPTVVPDINSCVIIPNALNSSNIIGTNYDGFGKTLIVKDGGQLDIQSNNTLTIANTVTVQPTGVFNLENAASLIQIDNVANTGSINMKRSAVADGNLDYVYWSTPVGGFNVNSITPLSTRVYSWSPTTATGYTSDFGNWSAASGGMTNGLGYIVGGSSGTSTFTGVPNNGDILTPISRSTFTGTAYTGPTSTQVTADDDNWNLLGNPYPSAIDADVFLAANSANINGFVKIWTHGIDPTAAIADPFYQDYQLNYDTNDYLTYNASGGTQFGFDGKIGAAQGFFVLMNDANSTAENALFNNTMRSNANRNDQFYRSGIEKHRIWLDIISPANKSVTTLVGYIADATNNLDNAFDAIAQGIKTNFEIYSIAESKELIIQGRSLPFQPNDEVTLGVTIPQNGIYTIAISSVDGLFADASQNIYLEDRQLGVFHNLRAAPYTFTGTTGTDENRFVLLYNASRLSQDDVAFNNNLTVVTNDNITVYSSMVNINSIEVYDLLGRNIKTYSNVNATECRLNTIAKNNTTLLLKINLNNGTTMHKKVIF